MPRQGLGDVRGFGGVLGGAGQPFYEVKLPLDLVPQLEQLLLAGGGRRGGVSVTSDFHDPNRLRVTRVDPPGYEAAAAARYVRGNTLSVSGRTGNSCNIDLSAKSGVPNLVHELQDARAAAASFILIRVPSRARHLVEIIPDVELASADDADLGQAGAALAGYVLPAEDFSDWEAGRPAEEHGR